MVVHYGEMDLGRREENQVKEFYRKVPPTGGRDNRIGRKELQEFLRIGNSDFKWIQEKLLEKGLIGTVQGGGIFRTPRGDETNFENFYYPPIMRELEQRWAEQPGREYHLRHRFLRVLNTSQGGRRPDGKWARPDITLLGGKVLPYLPGKFLDVITFEVKWGIPVEGLYEALAHRRRAYMLCVYPESWEEPDAALIASVTAEATRQGLGIIIARQEDDFVLWEEIVRPERYSPDPQELHDFLERQCDSDECLKDLEVWLQRSSSEMPEVTYRDLCRLDLTKEELDIARNISERLPDTPDSIGPTAFRDIGSDKLIARVRAVMRRRKSD